MSAPVIRSARASDVPAMLDIYRPFVENTTYTFEYAVPTEAEFAARLESVQSGFPWLVCEEEGNLLGYAYADWAFARAAYGWCADLSVYLRPEAQGKGLGRAFYTLLERMLTVQGCQVLYALVTGENRTSRLFHEALGYRRAAVLPDCGYKLGRWVSVYWYEKRLRPPVPPAGPLLPAAALDWTALDRGGLEGYCVLL